MFPNQTLHRILYFVEHSLAISRQDGVPCDMPRLLSRAGDKPRFLPPTTSVKIAQRMLSASYIVAGALSSGLYNAPVLEILLSLYLLEEDAAYLTKSDLSNAQRIDKMVVQRWLNVLVERGLVEEQADLIALTQSGYDQVNSLIEAVYNAQRALD